MHAPGVLLAVVRPDAARLARLPLPQPGRPGRGHDLRVDDARVRPGARLAQRLGDLPRRRARDGLARRTIAAIYTFKLFDWHWAETHKGAALVGCVLWIALMTWICYRGIELSARIQQVLLSFEVVMLVIFAVVALVDVYGGNAAADSIKPQRRLVQPVRDDLRATWSWRCCSASSSTGAGTRAWRSTRSPRTPTRARAARPSSRRSCSWLIYLLVSAGAQAYHGTGFICRTKKTPRDVLNALGTGRARLGRRRQAS